MTLTWHAVCLWPLVFVLAVASGCGPALDKIQAAIDEVSRLRKTIESESSKWREKVDEAQLRFTKDLKHTINTDLRDNIDESIENMGIEARCEIDFVETKLLVYLRAVEEALVKKRDAIKEKGTLDGLTPEEIIDNVIKSLGHVQPFVCHVQSDKTFLIKHTNAYGEPDKFIIEGAAGTVRITGFALKRPKGDTRSYTLHIHGGDPQVRDVVDSGRYLTQSTTYRLLETISKLILVDC